MIDKPRNPYAAEDFANAVREASAKFSDLFDALLLNGYVVTAQLEDATETEKQLDGADKFVVIEFERVE